MSKELGLLVQAVHIREIWSSGPEFITASHLGAPVGWSPRCFPIVKLDHQSGQSRWKAHAGHRNQDPAFGLEAVWSRRRGAKQAQGRSYRSWDARQAFIANSLRHLLQSHAHEILGQGKCSKGSTFGEERTK